MAFEPALIIGHRLLLGCEIRCSLFRCLEYPGQGQVAWADPIAAQAFDTVIKAKTLQLIRLLPEAKQRLGLQVSRTSDFAKPAVDAIGFKTREVESRW